MADGDGGGFKPIATELNQSLVKPVMDEFGKQAEVAANSVFGVKINPQTKAQPNQQNNPNQDPKIAQKKQEDQQKINELMWRLNKMAKTEEEIRQIRNKREQEEQEKKKMEANKKQDDQQKQLQDQQNSAVLDPNLRDEMTKTESGKGKGVGG